MIRLWNPYVTAKPVGVRNNRYTVSALFLIVPILRLWKVTRRLLWPFILARREVKFSVFVLKKLDQSILFHSRETVDCLAGFSSVGH